MALMFPRLARNFVKNGYFPTDEPTLERALAALAPSDGPMCILDPCAGEGVAIAEAAHALGREQVKAFAVEYDAERAAHARRLVDRCIHGDLMDTLISRQSLACCGSILPMATCPRTPTATSATRARAAPGWKSCSTSVHCRCCSTAAYWSSSCRPTCSMLSWSDG
jgi:hypothetical protein